MAELSVYIHKMHIAKIFFDDEEQVFKHVQPNGKAGRLFLKLGILSILELSGPHKSLGGLEPFKITCEK